MQLHLRDRRQLCPRGCGLINSGDNMLKTEEIRRYIEQDIVSERKKLARIGMNYYAGKHDIEQYRIFFIDANGKLKEDFTKSNIRISHPFFRIIAEQEAQYILSGQEPLFNSDIPELQVRLDEYFNNNDDFNSELYYAVLGAIVKGFDVFYALFSKPYTLALFTTSHIVIRLPPQARTQRALIFYDRNPS